ncbi:MAG: hypothetical protein AB1938_09655 [Myxococcota bacterium]
MPMPMPPQLEAALAQVDAVLEQVEGKKIDLLKASWAEIEKGVIKLLGGPFKMQQPEHQVVALGLAAALGARLNAEHQAFWFPYRETPEGASLGFPDALIMLSPFGAVVDALRSGRLEKLDEVTKEIRNSLAQVKFGAGGGAPMRLTAEDYMRLFDPGFVQLVALDPVKTKQVWGSQPTKVANDLRDGLSRAAKLPPEAKKQLEAQLVTAVSRLEPGKTLLEQVARAPRVVETMGLLFGASGSTGAAAEEFWSDVVMPLLFTGAPASFPTLDEEELAAAKKGIDPLFLFLDVVPHQYPSPEEEGLLNAFPAAKLFLPDPAFEGAQQLRLIKVTTDAIAAPLAAFDPQKTREAIARFGAMLAEKTGPVAQKQGEAEAKMMLDAALTLLSDLKKLVSEGKDLYVRRLTEAEAASEPAIAQLRQALSGPRIILTS